MSGWDRLVGAPLAPFVGPFPHRPFLEVCAAHDQGDVHIVADGSNATALVMTRDTVRFLGDRHLTDYHSPLGTATGQLVALLIAEFGMVRFELDSLPEEAAAPLAASFEAEGRSTISEADESCRVLLLDGADPQGWESLLRPKDRHEVRRKRRRYEAVHGEPRVVAGPEHFDAFVALHRSAAGEKGGFMTDSMETFFADLLRLPSTRLDVLQRDGEVVAAALGFEHEDGYYLYNSAYDASLADLSPGIILIDHLIARTARQGTKRFDFLKGTETYKRRMGAVDRPLYRLVVVA